LFEDLAVNINYNSLSENRQEGAFRQIKCYQKINRSVSRNYGAYANAEKALAMFGTEAEERATFLRAPQATRPCGDGYCWSFARDAKAIHDLIEVTLVSYPIDGTKLSLIGHSMGCVMGLWLMTQNPSVFRFFASLGMGSPFEP